MESRAGFRACGSWSDIFPDTPYLSRRGMPPIPLAEIRLDPVQQCESVAEASAVRGDLQNQPGSGAPFDKATGSWERGEALYPGNSGLFSLYQYRANAGKSACVPARPGERAPVR